MIKSNINWIMEILESLFVRNQGEQVLSDHFVRMQNLLYELLVYH